MTGLLGRARGTGLPRWEKDKNDKSTEESRGDRSIQDMWGDRST